MLGKHKKMTISEFEKWSRFVSSLRDKAVAGRWILHSIMPIYGSSFSLFTAMQILDMYNQVLYNYKNITNV